MKNIFRILMAVAVLFTASCAKEDISSSIAGGEVEVTFTASLPELGTRAFGEGKLAKQLTVNVYEHGTNEALTALDRKVTSETGVFTFQLVLLKGMKYDIVLWAQNATCGHYTLTNKVVTMNYTDVNANDESRDAFYYYVQGFDPAVDTPTFALTRPFAQLNAAVNQSDIQALENSHIELEDLTTSTVKVKTYTTLNIATGVVGGETTVEFVPTAMPKETFNTDYTLLSMNYILVPQDAVNAKMVSDVEFTFKANKNGSESAFSGTKYFNVPLKRNYRTNILGSLLTKPTDFTVTIDAVFTEPAEEILVKPWDGTTEAVTPDANGVYSVSTANQLAWLAEQVNAGNDFAGKTINLTNDIDLNNIPWTPIGLGELSTPFSGTLDGAKATRSGDCYTIRNLYVAPTKGEYTAAGLFGRLHGCVKNLVIDGAYVEHTTSGNADGATTNGIAVVAGSTYNSNIETAVENVTVKNATVKGNRYVAGIIGFADNSVKNCTVESSAFILSCDNLKGSWDNADKGGSIIGYSNTTNYGFQVNVTGCVVKDVTITGYRDLGGIIGYARGNISGNTIESVKLIVDNSHNYKNYTKASEYDLGSIYGEKSSTAVVENNTGEAEMILPADSTDALKAAIDNANGQPVTIVLKEGTYTMPSVTNGDVTIIGNGDVVLDQTNKKPAFHNTNLNFENVTIKYATNGTYVGFQHLPSANYKNCVIEGQVFLYGENEVFEKCTFVTTDAENYNVWTYGATNVVFNECTFNCAGKSILVYKEVLDNIVRTVTLNDCTINASAPVNGKAAVEVDSSSPNALSDTGSYVVNINNTTANGFANGNVSGNSLWNNKKGDKLTVYVDGACVLAPTPKADANGNYAVQTAAGLQNAIASAAAGATITLAEGTYEGHFDLTGKNITLLSTEGAVIKGSLWIDTCAPVIKGLTLTNPNGVQHPNPTSSQYYTTVNNQYPLVGAYNNANVRFENCVFDIVGPTVYGFYGYAHNSPVFEACTFNCNGIRPIANNGDALTINGCTFNDQYHYSARIFENSGELQTVVYTNNTVQGTNAKGEFEGINISKKGGSAVVLGNFTIKGNTNTLKYRHHNAVTMSDACTYDTDIANFAFEKEQ